jgi:hypothetical protein
MNFKTKIAYTAVLATLGLAAGSAQAAYLSETGTGDALIYPYYTVQGGYDTYLSVVNTTTRAKAVKVRFLEAKNTAEVLDFNLYLSPEDVWTGAITAVSATDATLGGKLVSTDKSCTSPHRPNGINENFRNYQYVSDDLGAEMARTREGYVEILEMGVIEAPALVTAVTHVNGVPPGCATLTDAAFEATGALSAPTGGLIGTGTLINVAAGTDYSYDSVALDDTFRKAYYTRAGSLYPSLGDAHNQSTVIRRAGNQQQVLTSTWGTAENVRPVSAVLMHRNVMNEYSVETVLNAGTDWVVTFPTKRLHLGGAPTVKVSAATEPFTQKLTVNGACEPVDMNYYDREEARPVSSVDFSPLPPTGVNSLCWEANVITFKNSKVLASALVQNNVDVLYQNGWLNLGFSALGHKMTSIDTSVNGVGAVSATYYGLPATGFAVQRWINGNVGGALSNYGGSYVHKYRNAVTLP